MALTDSESKVGQSKKPYEPPQLTVYGSIAEITKGGIGGDFDAEGGASNPTKGL